MKKYQYVLVSFPLLTLLCSLAIAQTSTSDKKENSQTFQKDVEQGLKELKALPRHRKIYYFGKEPHPFIINDTSGITISSNCGDIIPNKCLASQKLNDADTLLLDDDDRMGGKNPGSVMCQKLLKGKVRFGKDLEGNSSTFCAFSDGSMVSSDTITFWGNKNAKKKNP